jgi:hypothetical protein
LQDRLCSVHAAEALSGDWRRLCDVKVKVTISAISERGKRLKLIGFSLFHDLDFGPKSRPSHRLKTGSGGAQRQIARQSASGEGQKRPAMR